MSIIKGDKRAPIEEFVKKVGLVEVNVVAINPTLKEKEEILGHNIEDDAEEPDYTGTSKDGNPYLRVDVWLKRDSEENQDFFKAVFFLEDKVRVNKDETKTQFINNIGNCSWADEEENLPAWFAKRDFREAKNGEEDFYNFLRTWLGALDYRKDTTELVLDWKALMKGDVSDLKEQIGGDYAVTFVALATIVTKVREDEETGEDIVSEFQSIYNRQFLPQYCMKHFRVKNYNDDMVVANIQGKTLKDLKLHEKFVFNVTGDYGCKDFYKLSEIENYNPEENLALSDDAMIDADDEASSDY